MTKSERLTGSLWGTAIGDALGLCREGLAPARARKLYPNLDEYQLFGGRGLASDDTEHAAFTVWAMQQPEQFEQRLRHALRRWLWALPAGIGLATLRAGVKLSLGFKSSGVFSAGNGPLMRAPALAVCAGDDLHRKLLISTCLTHTDPRAYQGALMVAETTRYLMGDASWDQVLEAVTDPYLREKLQNMGEFPQQSPQHYVIEQGWHKGVSGFVYHTAPAVVQAALHHRDDYRAAIKSVIECGGDSDTTAAIVGGMLGARLGARALPADWIGGYADRPHSLQYLEQLATGQVTSLPNFALCMGRNLLFGATVLGYGVRRLLPPY